MPRVAAMLLFVIALAVLAALDATVAAAPAYALFAAGSWLLVAAPQRQ